MPWSSCGQEQQLDVRYVAVAGVTTGLSGSFPSLAQVAQRVFSQGPWVLWLRTHLRPQAPTPNHVHSGGLAHGGRQDEDQQSPHDPGVWGGDPGWGDAGTAALCGRCREGREAPGLTGWNEDRGETWEPVGWR